MTAVTPGALQLLLRLLEAKELAYTHSALASFHGRPGEELIVSGLLVEAGHDHVVRDDDDDGAMVDVDSDYYNEGLGIHSRTSGFVRVDKQTLLRYAPRIENLFRQLLGAELAFPTGGPRRLDEPGSFWDLGVARLTRQGPTSLWFGRRLHDLAVSSALADLVTLMPSTKPRLVLTTTATADLTRDHPAGIIVVPIADVLAGMNPVKIDFGMLQARFAGQPAPRHAVLHLSDDNRVLTIHGREVHFQKTRSKIQSILRQLYNAYLSDRWLRTSDVLEKAESGAQSLDQAFGARWVEVKQVIEQHAGMCRINPSLV